jgi:hypothetical protein
MIPLCGGARLAVRRLAVGRATAEREMHMSDVRTEGEAAEAARLAAYERTPGVGLDAAAAERDPAGDYSLVSDSSGTVGSVAPVEYADPGPAGGGTFGGA